MLALSLCTVLGSALTIVPNIFGVDVTYTLHRLGVQLYTLAALVGVFALNACIRLVRQISTDEDVNGRTEGSVVYGAYVLLAMPIIALADSIRAKRRLLQ